VLRESREISASETEEIAIETLKIWKFFEGSNLRYYLTDSYGVTT
jgi:hypothetical protein